MVGFLRVRDDLACKVLKRLYFVDILRCSVWPDGRTVQPFTEDDWFYQKLKSFLVKTFLDPVNMRKLGKAWWHYACDEDVKWGSSRTRKSSADFYGFNFFPKNVMLRSWGSLLSICLVPSTRNLVLSGLINRWFSQTHWAVLSRSCSSFRMDWSISLSWNDRNSFESST